MLKEGEIRIPSGCAISGMISTSGKKINGSKIVQSIATMHDRSNGLGGGFAGYGIYPQYKDLYAFHVFYDSNKSREECERFLDRHFDIINLSKIPVKPNQTITAEPLIWRYFVNPLPTKLTDSQLDEKEFVTRSVININSNIAWTAHGRYPTNTPGWWGGAHPFAMLDYSIVHNGEISSYDANRRDIEMYGYKCTLQTDTEVITYIIDYLLRKQKLSLEDAANVIAAPFWSTIESMPKKERDKLNYLRNAFPGLLITGPFSIILGFEGGLMALNDRLKLRSMVIGEKDDMVYMASEECAIRVIEPELDRIWSPKGGEPVIATLQPKAMARL